MLVGLCPTSASASREDFFPSFSPFGISKTKNRHFLSEHAGLSWKEGKGQGCDSYGDVAFSGGRIDTLGM
ncbi:hypothetical protein AV530_019470 [Patagioenas fasciata monilis]|uniref:Uncharacterized protein n=1 Tax=Patagioenas fasciata monilis TaxID=372326 RepID=A0A1V4JDX0_PATFA|nr:hypothetical protein AV530_019470 [Patagioenas fasciata monilis]